MLFYGKQDRRKDNSLSWRSWTDNTPLLPRLQVLYSGSGRGAEDTVEQYHIPSPCAAAPDLLVDPLDRIRQVELLSEEEGDTRACGAQLPAHDAPAAVDADIQPFDSPDMPHPDWTEHGREHDP